MQINLSTVNHFFQAVSLIFQEILALESQQAKSTHNQALPASEVEALTNNETPGQ